MSSLQDPRVLFAAERTLLAWIRTSLTFIMFGFLIERSGLLLEILSTNQTMLNTELTFWLGLAFIVLGVFSGLYAGTQYRNVLKTLNAAEFPEGYRSHWGIWISMIVAVLGSALAACLFFSYH